VIRTGVQYATEDAPDERAPPGVERPALQTVTKAEAVYLETRARILSGALSPGLQVNQEALAASLGVSITPLREALRRLEMEGLARLEAHRTVVIAPLIGRELDELYVIRMELDALGRIGRREGERRASFAHRRACAANGGQGPVGAARAQPRLPPRNLRIL
jgi:Bacterial regulatory proteins, gntR family